MINVLIALLRRGLHSLTLLRAVKGGPMNMVRWGVNTLIYTKFMRKMFWRK